MNFRNLAGACLISIGTCAHALDEVVVTPARYAQSLGEVVPSVVVITREMIERSPSVDIAGLLRWHAGLEISRTGGTGQQTSVFIRGTESDHATVLINGVKMNSATVGIGALEMINTSVIDRIEIVKGPRSTVYGSDAVGGVINIITSNFGQDDENSASFHVMQGRYGMDEQGVRLRYGNDQALGNLSFSRLDTQGFPARNTSGTDHGHDNETFDFNIQTKVGAGEVALGFWQAKGNTEYDNFGSDNDQDRKNNILRAALTVPVSDNWHSTLSMSRTKDEIRQNQENSLSSGNKDFAFTDRVVYDWKNDFTLNDHVLVLGASLADEDTDSLSFGTSYRENTDIYSVYLHDRFARNRHSLFTATRYTDHEDFGSAVTWNLEYGYSLATQTRLSASVGTGFRAPNSSSRFGFGGNPDLREETSRSIEAGISYDLNPLTALSLRIFDNRIEDLIDWDVTISQNRNIERARIKGIEAALSHQSGPWDIRLEGIIQNPRNETENSRLLRRAKRTLTGSLAYSREQFFVQINSLVTSQRRDFGDVALSGYGLVDVSAGYHFPYVTLALKAENLLDKEFELASGYNQPGQSVFAELQIKPM
ncbi:MAG: TonB-dependent receptor [Proteobacteria bacterium]|nr:TonB-dependent receptor [Pseudomonadota bacterium]